MKAEKFFSKIEKLGKIQNDRVATLIMDLTFALSALHTLCAPFERAAGAAHTPGEVSGHPRRL